MQNAFHFLSLKLICFSLLFSTAAIADSDLVAPLIGQGDSAPGTLRIIGKYPGDSARTGQTVTQLEDGSVFVYGAIANGAIENGMVVLDPKKRIYSAAYLMPAAISWDPKRHGWVKHGLPPECPHTGFLHSATLLANNKILFAGGLCDQPRMLNDDSALPAAAYNKLSLWNQTSQKWESAPALAQGRLYHSASLLADGSVMVIGGEDDRRSSDNVEPVLASVELFRDAADGHAAEVLPLAPLHTARARHTSTRMDDNSVVVVGGIDSANHKLASVEIFDPKTRTWKDGPALNTARIQHSAVLLDDGRLMIAGGINQAGKPVSSVEIYDPATNRWIESAPLLVPLRTLSATKLSNGDVLVIGTSANEYLHTVSRSMLWQKASGQWQTAGTLNPDGLSDIHDAETYHLLAQKNGDALVLGNSTLMRWLPAQKNVTSYVPISDRTAYATAILPDGRILLAGGRTGNNPTSLAEIYDPATNQFKLTGTMLQARYTGMPYQSSLSSIVLKDGRVIVAGGWVRAPGDPETPVANSPDIWDPVTGQWSVISAIQFQPSDRVYFNAMQDGRVLFFVSRVQEDKGIAEFRALIWNPDTNQVLPRSVSTTGHADAGIAVLNDGRVLIVGGRQFQFTPEYRCPHIKRGADSRGKARTDIDDDGDGCQDEPAHWLALDNATAELWNSNTGTSTQLSYPDRLHPSLPQTLLLKSGDVVVLNADQASPFSQPVQGSPMLWNARTLSFSALPPLATNLNWPMTESGDGSLIAWAPENINPANAQRLKPGANRWEPMPRFPQKRATVISLPSEKLLALASTSPNVATWDDKSSQWRLNQNTYLHVENPALVELRDGALAVVGTVFGNKIAVQTWNPKTDTWSMTRAIQSDRSATGKAIRLPSGAVMNFSYGPVGTLLCDIWRPVDDSWKYCGSFTSENKNKYLDFALGALEDGRVAFMANSESATVYEEESSNWKTMKAEWNPDSYRYGEAVRADKPLARFFDAEKNKWLDASEAGGKYYSTVQSESVTPAMLWDRKQKRWAYISGSGMGKNAFWLPDGCAISGLPFKIYNALDGKVTTIVEPVAGSDAGVMTVLADGTVAAIVKAHAGTGVESHFFHRKATCAGFETAPGDADLMPAVYATDLPAPNVVATVAASKTTPLGTTLMATFYAYRWLALAVILPFFVYFVLHKGIQLVRNKYPTSILVKPIGKSNPSRATFSLTRVIVYGLVLLIAVPMLMNYLAFRSARVAEDCQSLPVNTDSKLPRSEQISACINKKSGLLSGIFSREEKPHAAFPCRFIGVWSSSRRGIPSRVTLQADGKYVFEEGDISTSGKRPVVGHWEIQGGNMVWYHANMEDHPDINKILNQTESNFTLVEENGDHTEFELIKAGKSEECMR